MGVVWGDVGAVAGVARRPGGEKIVGVLGV